MPEWYWIAGGLVAWLLASVGVGYVLGRVIHHGQGDDA